MKILFVTDLYKIDNNSDSRALNDFTETWKAQGHEVFVIRPNFLFNTLLRNKKISKEGEYLENGVKVLNLNFLTPFWFNVFDKLPKDFNLKNYDVLISHMPSGALFSLRLTEKETIPYCISVHCSDIEVLSNPLYFLYFQQKLLCACKKADVISPRSFHLKTKIGKYINDKKIFPALSGVKEEEILSEDELREKIRAFKNGEKLIITTVSGLIKRKNTDVILKALSKIKEFDFEFRIIGEGKEKNKLINLTKKLNLEEKVKFLGKIPHSEVLEKLRESNIFVLLSQRETLGLSYLEATAKGNIVICTKDDGIDGLIENNKNGFSLEPAPDKLAEKLIEVYNFDEEKIADLLINTRKTALENTSWQACERYLNNIFN
ncbi:glycosyltransferase [bacterium]|nr:glycosyltransferase [bacterium]